jgi:hypothetical protein
MLKRNAMFILWVGSLIVSMGSFIPSFQAFCQSDEDLSKEMRELKKQIEEQKKEIGKLQSDVEKQNRKIEAAAEEKKKSNESKSLQWGPFSLNGDVRARYEPFFQEGEVDRHRERIRARLNLYSKIAGDFSGGISLATGALDDPISPNQTMTGFFTRKNFALDRAFISYKPKNAPFLKLDAGKFAYPWFRTPLTFDNDLNPEGFAETLTFDLKNQSLKNVAVVGFQLPFNEAGRAPDSFVFGGQLQAHFQIGSAKLSFYGSGINVNRADPIAVALGNGTLRPSLPNSNTLIRNAQGEVTGYAEKFAYLDAIMKLELNPAKRAPVFILFDFVNNVRGSRERSGYWAEAVIGRLKEARDLQFGYTFVRIEKDAVIGAWNESDLRSSTNVIDHEARASYMIRNNVMGQFAAWIGRLANPLDNIDLVPPGVRDACIVGNASSCRDPFLKRLQFDIVYKF